MGLNEISYLEIEISYVEILLLQIEYICKAYDMNNTTHSQHILPKFTTLLPLFSRAKFRNSHAHAPHRTYPGSRQHYFVQLRNQALTFLSTI